MASVNFSCLLSPLLSNWEFQGRDKCQLEIALRCQQLISSCYFPVVTFCCSLPHRSANRLLCEPLITGLFCYCFAYILDFPFTLSLCKLNYSQPLSHCAEVVVRNSLLPVSFPEWFSVSLPFVPEPRWIKNHIGSLLCVHFIASRSYEAL